MAKKKATIFSYGVFDKQHKANIKKRLSEVGALIDEAIKQGAHIGEQTGFSDAGKPFYFSKYPAAQKKIDELMKSVSEGLTTTITDGDREEWLLSCSKNDKMIDALTSSTKLTKEQISKWKQQNLTALEAFQTRKANGMDLSGRVWNLTKQFKQELELALDIGLGDGKSAADLSRDVRKYLNEPNKLFRRVRDKHGELRLSKAAQAYHPGRGVYRSSYKNALRLTATENNMAYRKADSERWKQIPFVKGIKITVSHNNHPVPDICDELQGVYPKDFIWTGWHPFCRCAAVAVMPTEEEFLDYQRKLLAGEDVSGYKFSGTTEDVPDNFKAWVNDNKERIESAKKLPYFIQDNQKTVNNILNPKPTIEEIAAKRHAERTPEKEQQLREYWEQKKAEGEARRKHEALVIKTSNNVLKVAKDYGEIDYAELQEAVNAGDLARMETLMKSVAKSISAMKKQENALSDLIPDVHQWHKQFTISELQGVNSSVNSTIEAWLKKYNYSSWDEAPLLHKKAKLEYEIQSLITSKKYTTWEVTEKAYMRKLATVQDSIDFEGFGKKLVEHKNFIIDSGTKSIKYKNNVKKLEAAIAAKDKPTSQLLISELDSKKAELEKKAAKKPGVMVAPKSTNNTLQKSHVGSGLSEEERIEKVIELTGVDRNKAKDYIDTVHSFSFQWDYEIRQVQCGNNVISRHGHTIDEIKKKAKDLEEFISKSPQWDGGTTYRGMSLSDKELDNLRAELKAGNGNMLGSASWSTNKGISEGFSGDHIGEISPMFGDEKTNRVVLVTDKHKKATSIKHLSHYSGENEVLASSACRYRYVSEEIVHDYYDYIVITVEPK